MAQRNLILRFFSALWRLLNALRHIFVNLLFLLILILLFDLLFSGAPLKVPQDSALVLNLQGQVVEEESYIDPASALLGSSVQGEVLLQDVLDALQEAKNDPDIKLVVLELDGMASGGFSKLQEIAAALDDFKSSGKQVIANGSSYNQGQYLLASHADEIHLNPLGEVFIQGFGTYQLFFKSALNKLKLDFHIFRVGNYKSAVEPYERDAMSADAEEANLAWLNDLWQQYLDDVSAQRQLEPGFLEDYINHIDRHLEGHQGDTAALALDAGLVDQVSTKTDFRQYLVSLLGSSADNKSFKQIDYQGYINLKRTQQLYNENHKDKIGIIVARGTIYDGYRNPGAIGGDSLAELIRDARNNPDIKALVLRIDSGGGSAFASEVIRDELLQIKAAGIPLVISMSSTAASGGYWIATAGDEIWASPSTLTGSIGIFSLYPKLEDSLDAVGIHVDGVGTTDMTDAFLPGRPLPPAMVNAIQGTLENGYRRFLNLVAEGRDMTIDEVETLAQGRVWSGNSALASGLVDQLGNLEQAIQSAAGLAGLDNYSKVYLSRPLSSMEQFLRQLSENTRLDLLTGKIHLSPLPQNPAWQRLYGEISTSLQDLLEANDPKGMYLKCLECNLL